MVKEKERTSKKFLAITIVIALIMAAGVALMSVTDSAVNWWRVPSQEKHVAVIHTEAFVFTDIDGLISNFAYVDWFDNCFDAEVAVAGGSRDYDMYVIGPDIPPYQTDTGCLISILELDPHKKFVCATSAWYGSFYTECVNRGITTVSISELGSDSANYKAEMYTVFYGALTP